MHHCLKGMDAPGQSANNGGVLALLGADKGR